MAQRDNLYQPGAIAPGQPQQHHPAACRDALYHQTSLPKALDCGNLLPLSRSQPAGPAPFKLTRLRTSAPQALNRCQNYSSPSRTECAYQPLPTHPGHAEAPYSHPLPAKPHISVHTGPSLLSIHPIGPIRPIRPIPPSPGVFFGQFKRLPALQPRPTSAARQPHSTTRAIGRLIPSQPRTLCS